MRIPRIIIISLSLSLTIFSQPTTEFGDVSPDEFKINSFPGDDAAEAVVIYDMGDIYFRDNASGGFDVIFEKRVKIKVLNDAGLKWGELEIPLYRKGDIYEKLESVSGFTINVENNSIVKYKLDPEKKYKEKVNEYYDLIKIALPNVKAGSIIEYVYKVSTQYAFQLPDWEFQTTIPVIYSQCKLKMIPFYTYVFLLQGTNSFDHKESYVEKGLPRHYAGLEYHDMVYVYALKNIPAFRDEGFISSFDDYVIKLGFQLQMIRQPTGTEINKMTTWEEMVKFFLKESDFTGYVNSAEKKAKDILAALDIQGKSEEEKAKQIVDHVKQNYNWDGKKRVFAVKKVKDLMEEKTGSTAELNLFLTGLLKAAQINAVPVILSTREHGKISYDYPFVHFFNTVIVLVTIGEKQFLTDGTSILYPYNDIPLYCINQRGLVIEKGDVQWAELSFPGTPSEINKSFRFTFDDSSGKLNCKFNTSATGYEGVGLKNLFDNEHGKFEKYMEEKGYGSIDSITMENFGKPEEAYLINCNFMADVEKIDDKVFISPFLNEPPRENIFKQSNRQNDIDMVYTYSKRYKSEMVIPDGYKVTYSPRDVDLENKFVSIVSTTKIEGGVIIREASYGFKYPVFKAETYNYLKYFYGEIVKQLNDKIILEKAD